MGLKSELLAFTFGIFIILVTFGDTHPIIPGLLIGNLDTMLGLQLWPILDVIYPLATIAVFLVYAKSKGITPKTKTPLFLTITLLIALALMNIDDIFIGLNHIGLQTPANLTSTYWIAISWIYPTTAAATLFLIGKQSKKN